MAKNVEDRRVRRTRTLLSNSLIQLLNSKDISDISVKELVDLADISRGTFYLHYRDVYDMINQIENNLYTEFEEILNRDLYKESQIRSPRQLLLDVLYFFERNCDMVHSLSGPHGDISFVEQLSNSIKDRLAILLKDISLESGYEYIFAFVVNGFIGVIKEWMSAKSKRTPDEIADLATRLILPAIQPLSNT